MQVIYINKLMICFQMCILATHVTGTLQSDKDF